MNALIMEVRKALMPQDAQLVSGQVIDAVEMWIQLYFFSSGRRTIMAATWSRRGWNTSRIRSRLRWEFWCRWVLHVKRIQVQISLVAKALVVE